MMKYNEVICFALFSASILMACGGSNDSDDRTSEPDPILLPSASNLIFPDNNTECNEGVIISDTESRVTFRWSNSENTDSYTLSLRNLDTNNSQNFNANTNELDIAVLRGTPYSWFVTSNSNSSNKTAVSDTWKFYNAGLAIENYSPFPAELVIPEMGTSVPEGMLTLSWTGNDIDDDIVSYEVFIDTNSTPTTSLGNFETASAEVEVSSGQIYYWRVRTDDSKGNSSESEIYQFRVE